MYFTWDQAKYQRTLKERGVDFAVAARIFEGPVLEWDDIRADHGEIRTIAIGVVEGREHVVVYTDRDSGRHIISARKANERERRAYHAKSG